MSTGYANSTIPPRKVFDSDNDDFELWEVKFRAQLRLAKLDVILTMDPPDADPQLAEYNSKNSDIYSMLVMNLEDKAINLIMRECPGEGKAALDVLKNHFLGTSKPRVISLYCEHSIANSRV